MGEKLAMFGKSYNNLGDNKAHLCLSTAGDVKIKTPNRFFTLFKNGKLNIDDVSEIFHVSSEEEMKKTGIYLVSSTNENGEESQNVFLYLDGNKILLASDSDGFISYTAEQTLTPDQITLALKNIGIYFETMDDAKAVNPKQGIVYILDEQKLYKVSNGEFVEFTATSGPGSEESSEEETTEEILESLQIGGIFIDGISNIINGEGSVIIQVSGTDYIWFKNDKIYFKKDVIIDPTQTIRTDTAEEGVSGFMIYTKDDETWLEIDNLIVHNSSSEYEPSLAGVYIGTPTKNLIRTASWVTAPETMSFILKYKNEFQVGDKVAIQTAGGNLVTITFKQGNKSNDADDSDEGTPTQWVVATLENPPSQNTVLKITFTVPTGGEDASGEPITREETVTVTIPPTVWDDEVGMNVPNTTGQSEINPDWEVDDIIKVDITGDADIYYATAESPAGQDMPTLFVGTVTNDNPFTVEFPGQSNSSESVLRNLEGTIIYKMGSETDTYYIIYHSGADISLEECNVAGGNLERKTLSKIGNLSGIEKPAASPTGPTEYFDGYGIYSDHFIGVDSTLYNGTFYGGTFDGIAGDEYPTYGTNLEAPTTNIDDAAYDKVIPTVGWVKALIQQAIDALTPPEPETPPTP